MEYSTKASDYLYNSRKAYTVDSRYLELAYLE